MADQSIDNGLFWLLDRWPGVPLNAADKPVDGFTGTAHYNVASAAYPKGMKIQVLCDNTSYPVGYSTLMYLKLKTASDACTTGKAKCICLPATSATVTTTPFEVTAEADDDIPASQAIAICIGNMTAARWGWFWVGGVCPVQHVGTGIDGTYATDSKVLAGPMEVGDLGTTSSTLGDFGFTIPVTNATNLPCAIALKSDS